MRTIQLLPFLLASGFSIGHSQTVYPPNIFQDSTNAPFVHGVASGDPLPQKVILWTRIDPGTDTLSSHSVSWKIAADSAFTSVVDSGSFVTDSSRDFTVKVEASGLTAHTTYYYQFRDVSGNTSVIGRTKTAPNGPSSELNVSLMSCSSIYSGFFNAYRRLSERDELDLCIHLGDYVYDFVDGDEEVRVPDPYPTDPSTKAEWQDRHKYYLMDPDLRAARQMHPFVMIWDNHDISNPREASLQTFLDYNPIREDTIRPEKIWRKFSYGDLLEIFMLDINLYRDSILLAPDEYSLLGTEQYDWFIDGLKTSSATWKLVGSSKMFSRWGLDNLQWLLPTPDAVFNNSAWDGYGLERRMILEEIDSSGIDNVVLISGDAHLFIASDLTIDPTDGGIYDPETGSGGLGVEFMGASISRGNFDEAGFPASLQDIIANLSQIENPHHREVNLIDHGYGLLTFQTDSMVGTNWYSDILNQTSSESKGEEMVVLNGDNHWKRDISAFSAVPRTDAPITVSEIFPNPTKEFMSLRIHANSPTPVRIQIYEIGSGKEVFQQLDFVFRKDQTEEITLPVSSLSSGKYAVKIRAGGHDISKVLLID